MTLSTICPLLLATPFAASLLELTIELLPLITKVGLRIVAFRRDTVTPAVHYVRFPFTEAQVAAFRDAEEVALVATHPAYEARTVLPAAVRHELLGDLQGTTKALPIG